jgi:hypothetical protein
MFGTLTHDSILLLLLLFLFRNWNKIRIFSPDELTSNRLDKVLEVTKRNYQWVQNTANQDGRILEVLSEHLCQGYSHSLSSLSSHFPTFLVIPIDNRWLSGGCKAILSPEELEYSHLMRHFWESSVSPVFSNQTLRK